MLRMNEDIKNDPNILIERELYEKRKHYQIAKDNPSSAKTERD